MHTVPLRIVLIAILALLLPSSLLAAAEQRTALVIGNGAYSPGPLKNPVNDAADMAANLEKLGFSVTLKKDAGHRVMEESIHEFGEKLKKGGVGLFFYAGHGVQIAGRNYLVPIGAKIIKETDAKFEAVDVEMVLAEMGNAGNSLNIVVLDACRDNPFVRRFRTAGQGLAMISDAPKGTFITYSTSPGKVAADGSGRNSPYTESLIRHMTSPGLPIEEVFKKVRQDMGKKTGGQQVPWELSSLEGQFYFRPRAVTETAKAAAPVDYAAEQQKIDEAKESLAKEKRLLDQQENIAEERLRLEEKKKQIAAIKGQSAAATEIKRDGRFIAYSDGTVLDTQTNLMWVDKDNGHNINWWDAKSHCEKCRVGGYSDWRMPMQHELQGLYDVTKVYLSGCGRDAHLTELVRLSCTALWASETRGSNAAVFGFDPGSPHWASQSRVKGTRALPVRSVK